VPRGRVLALRALEESAGDRRSARLRRAAIERHHVSEPERFEIGQVETADGAGRVAQGVRAFVSVLPCVRQLSSTGRRRARLRTLAARGYSTAALDDALGLLLLVVYIVGILAISAGITYGVIKIFPTERKPKNPDKQESSEPPASDGEGRLFRRSKRATT